MTSSFRRRPHLGREIALVLAVKLVALLAIWNIWFSQPQAPKLDAGQVASSVYASQPAVQERTDSHAQP